MRNGRGDREERGGGAHTQGRGDREEGEGHTHKGERKRMGWTVTHILCIKATVNINNWLTTGIHHNRENTTDWFGTYRRHLIIRYILESPHLKIERDTISQKQTVP